MTDIPQSATHPSRRGFLGRAALVAAAPAAAAILVPTVIPASAAAAAAAPADDLPSFAPVVIGKYLGKLAGADVFTVDNAYALFESMRVDTGALGPFGIRP